ncbi:hypothetical protein BE08_22955 [Sorangium cellulosum]|uniref:Uncharacterized protein n=1 Tax=Sorangium cellulosum TaxID=56 RepID=A0A150PJ40_SORCE|nr:hypothetical protein BE08_22955 [Sorangium cellulosum]
MNTQGGSPRTIPYQFTHAPLTSTIEAENFDYGYEGLAYHDTTVGNATGFYRGQHVDLEPTADTSTGPGANVTGTARVARCLFHRLFDGAGSSSG